MQPDPRPGKLTSQTVMLLCLLATSLPSMAADPAPAAPGQRPTLSNGQRPVRSARGPFTPLTVTTAPFTLQGGAMPSGGSGSFAPITMTAFAPMMMVVHPSVQAKSVQELVTLAKANPGQINYASGGLGTSTHLPAELFISMAGVKMVHVPYKGGGPALLGVMSGQSQMLLISMVGALPHVKSGKLRAIALTSSKRMPELPEMPTVSESGVPGYEVVVWYGIFAPNGTPASIVNLLHGAIIKILQTREMRERFAADGAQPLGNTPAEFAVINRAEVAKWAKVVREARIKAE